MACVVLVFFSAKTAEFLVAGVPAAARAAREVALAGAAQCRFVVPGGWTPSAWCRAELQRLAPELRWEVVEHEATSDIRLRGEALLAAEAVAAALNGASLPFDGTDAHKSEDEVLADLRASGRALIAATGKPGDGIVSRYLNRPISQAISRMLLHLPGVTPFHATLGTMALAIAMTAALLFGGPAGLIAGALLFQAASVVDGVDGEIARATFRTSAAGAMLDSLTDAATNLAFIGGLTFNLWLHGQQAAAVAGIGGLVMLAIGLSLIGLRARAIGGPFTFDLIKHHVRRKNSRLMRWLTFLAMRDFIAAACAVTIVLGFAPYALVAFSIGTAIWLTVTVTVLLRTRTA